MPVYAVLDIYRFVFWRSRSRLSTLLLDKKGHAEDYYVRRDSAADRLREKMHVRYTISSDRGETLQGFYYPAGKKPGKKLVFIVHGYHSEHAETAGMFYDLYHSRGFDIFTCDNTASGESGGKLFGYNVFESADCLKWLNFLRSQFGEDIKVVLHGFSLGGATVLKMSDRCPDCVKFIVSDSGFIDAREILRSQLGPLYGLMAGLNRIVAGYDLAETDVRENIKNSPLPFLIVHGKDDKTVPFSMAPRIFELCPNDKDFLFTEGAKHIETMHIAPEAYARKLDPYAPGSVKGLKLPEITADAVVCSHRHSDHCCPEAVTLTGLKPGFAMRSIYTFHDESMGAKRGNNLMTVVTAEDLTVAHCGDLGHELNAETLRSLGKIDILLIPVGGVYTLDAKAAKRVCEQIKPTVIIPMHYRCGSVGIQSLAPVDEFLSLFDEAEINRLSSNTLTVEKPLAPSVTVFELLK